MEEINLTTATVISFSQQLEEDSAAFYEQLAERFTEHADTFMAAVKQSHKNKVWITRTYQETISDALEACFCFQGLNLKDYEIEWALPEGASYPEALRTAIALEDKTIAFYQDVAERSESLLATIPGAFKRAAKKRAARKRELEGLL